MPTKRPPKLDSPLVPKIIKLMSRAHVWLYQRSGGRIGKNWRVGAAFRKPAPNLLLEHRGRKSGKLFTTPLVYLVDGEDLVVVASQGGLPNHPQWYRNLVADPEAAVQIGTERRLVRAPLAAAAARARLWRIVVDLY
ncbi:nitroreductase/quinone reductase family protein, partial [Nocardia cyriacigeorgica]|uniref:nitroreductase/quinone reductase family protein n=1 Tax=Nocardia cyriacigeorgica TaxID=135487 RepID=UPI002455BED5